MPNPRVQPRGVRCKFDYGNKGTTTDVVENGKLVDQSNRNRTPVAATLMRSLTLPAIKRCKLHAVLPHAGTGRSFSGHKRAVGSEVAGRFHFFFVFPYLPRFPLSEDQLQSSAKMTLSFACH